MSSRLKVLPNEDPVSVEEVPHLIRRGQFGLNVADGTTADATIVNAILQAYEERARWYEELLDAIPFPLSVTDENMQWTFINRAAEEVTGKKRQDVVGQQCHNWGADICQTDRCGIAKLRAGEPRSFFRQPGIDRDFQVDVSYLKAGHVEVVQDVTEVVELRQRAEAEARARAEEAEALRSQIQGIVTVLEAVSRGDLSVDPQVEGTGAIAEISKTLSRLIRRLRDDVGQITTAAHQLEDSSGQSRTETERALSAASRASTDAAEVARSIGRANESVSGISSSLEQLDTTIASIADHAERGADVAGEAVERAGSADSLVNQLSTSSSRIGEVVKVINAIAQQTNLLSLNATIEAARAGEAGKGFSVVAHEVKELAKETAAATEEIASQIEAIQNDAKETATAIADIGGVIARIHDLQQEIAAAVEGQRVSTSSISGSFRDIVSETAAAAQAASKVVEDSNEVQAVVGQTLGVASDVASTAQSLSHLVRRFQLAEATAHQRAPL